MGRRRAGRNIDGVILLDKPAGITSNAALQSVRRLLGARKAGHTGSLDPFATGMLPICLGEASKTAAFMLDADKVYDATALLENLTQRQREAILAKMSPRDVAEVERLQRYPPRTAGRRGAARRSGHTPAPGSRRGTPLARPGPS